MNKRIQVSITFEKEKIFVSLPSEYFHIDLTDTCFEYGDSIVLKFGDAKITNFLFGKTFI